MELFGDYYAEKVLSLGKKNLTKRELLGSVCWNRTKLVQDLFGWQIHVAHPTKVTKKDVLDCRSELEARYVLVFLELGWREIYVPKSDKDIEEILPRLEYLKRRADELIADVLKTIFKRSLREEIRWKSYRKISATKKEENQAKLKEVA